MNIKYADTPSPQAQQKLEALRRAVSNALEKKRRLGQYAVVWQDDKSVLIGEDSPTARDTETSNIKNVP